MAHWSSWFRTPPSQGGDHGFESRMRYEVREVVVEIGGLFC